MNKHEQLEQVQEEYDRLLASFAGLDETALCAPGSGAWGVREVVAHIAGWFTLDAELMRRIASGQHPLPDGPAAYGTGETRNPDFARAAAAKSAAEVIVELHAAFAAFVGAADSLPEERFAEGRMAQRILEGNGWRHMAEHRAEIEAYVSSRRAT